jgi:hypothetical protein
LAIPVTVLEFGDRRLSFVDASAARDGQGSGMKTVWIGVSAVLSLVLLGIVGTVLILALRRRAARTSTNRTESDGEMPVAIESSLGGLNTFLSGENALSQDGISVTRKVPGGPEHSRHEWDE